MSVTRRREKRGGKRKSARRKQSARRGQKDASAKVGLTAALAPGSREG